MSQIIDSNAGYHFFFNQSDDISTIVAARTLNEPHATKLLMSLMPGECIYKESQGPVPYGMKVLIDHLPANRNVRPKDFDHHPYTTEVSIHQFPELMKAIKKLLDEVSTAKIQNKARKTGLPVNARKLLDLASCAKIITPVSKLWHIIGNLSPTQKKSIMKKLEDKGLVKFVSARTGRINLFLPEITDKGWQYLNKPKYSAGGGGDTKHQFAIQVLYSIGILRKYESHIEYKTSEGNICDNLWILPDGTVICLEVVTTCDRNIIDHIKACFIDSSQIDEVRIVTFQKSEHAKLQKKVSSEELLNPFKDKIKYESLEPYVKELWP